MGDILPVATRATRAAWPSAVPIVHEPTRNSRPHNLDSAQAPVGVSAHNGHQLNDSGAPSRLTGGGDIPNAASHHSSAPFRVRDGGYTQNPSLHSDAQATRLEQQHNLRTIDAPTRDASNYTEDDTTGSVLDHTLHFRPHNSGFVNTSASGARESYQVPHSSTQAEGRSIQFLFIMYCTVIFFFG